LSSPSTGKQARLVPHQVRAAEHLAEVIYDMGHVVERNTQIAEVYKNLLTPEQSMSG
jgi:hypothetical protein